MRIIGGELKGRKLQPPSKMSSRPTTDFAREALFNLLHHRIDVQDLSVLDLFSGTGAVSLEFWSRGCRDITSVEKNAGMCRFLSSIIRDWQLEGMIIHRGDVMQFLKQTDRSYDLIFADPPYDWEGYEKLVETLLTADVLGDGGMLILEHDKFRSFSSQTQFREQRTYGHVNFSFFEKDLRV